MATLPQPLKDMLQDKVFVHLATLMPDGSPQSSPVWVDLDGDEILINTAVGRTKDRNMKRDARVALSVTATDSPYRAYMLALQKDTKDPFMRAGDEEPVKAPEGQDKPIPSEENWPPTSVKKLCGLPIL